MDELKVIRNAIMSDHGNDWASGQGWDPIYSAHKSAKIVIIGQAPGRLAQASGIPWDDPSGRNLRNWMGVSEKMFYDSENIALIPMDFYFPGSGERGDIAPRKEFAKKWHGLILSQLNQVKLTLLIGSYAQNYYLANTRKKSLTDTVRDYRAYLPQFFPLVHPSPRNNIWHKKNPWFKDELLIALQKHVFEILQQQE
ncbi:MAG: uracil-DNA glycosylase family protein [Robiginitomaculum sp.]|nr:uracil-DNA glycosylase family protein [Robiginitomaculum sp.]